MNRLFSARTSLKTLCLGLNVVLAAASFLPGAALSQQYPNRAIKVVVPFPPGSSTDVLARLEIDSIAKRLGQPMIIDNQGGAGGLVGGMMVVKSAPDGYTLFVGAAGPVMMQPLMNPNPAYNPTRDLVPIGQMHTLDLLLVARTSLPANTLMEVLALARAKPGALTYGTSGIGGNAHVGIALLSQMSGTEMLHVPYKGDIDSIGALARGEVDISQTGAAASLPLIKAGKIKAIIAAGKSRSALYPDVPTAAESGLPGFVVVSFVGLHAPVGTPPDIIKRLNTELVAAIKEPAIRERLLKSGATPVGGTPEEYAEFLRSETEKWSVAIKKAGLGK